MTLVRIFDFGGHPVRTAGTADAPLFCAADVCGVLDIARVDAAVNRLDPDEVEVVSAAKNGSRAVVVSGDDANLYVTESGLFSLILGSRKPEAKAFKKWVTSEVLPEIRRKGYYDAIEAQERKTTARLLAEIFPNAPSKSAPIFSELIAALLKLRREVDVPGNPPWARSLARFVYGLAIPVEGEQQHRRALNPSPNGAAVDHSMLNEVARERVRQVAFAGAAFARASVSWDDWKAKMELAFGTKPLQLPFLVPMLTPPKDPEAAE